MVRERSEVEAAIAQALAQCKLATSALGLIASAEAKADEAGIVDAAAALGARLVLVSQAALVEASGRVITKSERVQELFGVPSRSAKLPRLPPVGRNAALRLRRELLLVP